LVDVNLDGFIPNPTEKVSSAPNGLPMIKVVIGGTDGREEYYINKATEQYQWRKLQFYKRTITRCLQCYIE